MASLHLNKGGKKSKKLHVPTQQEAFALAVGSAMYWTKFRTSMNPSFYRNIAEEVRYVCALACSSRRLRLIEVNSRLLSTGVLAGCVLWPPPAHE